MVLAPSSNPGSHRYSATIFQAGQSLHTRQFTSLSNSEKQAIVSGISDCVADPTLLKGYERLLSKCSPFSSLAEANAQLAKERAEVISD